MLNDASKLQDHFPWNFDDNIISQLENEIILCEDDKSMASDFTFTCLLVQYLKNGFICHLLCTNSSLLHYEYILRKAGVDMATCLKENLLRLYCINDDTEQWTYIRQSIPHLQESSPFSFPSNALNSKKIDDIMIHIITEQHENRNTTVMKRKEILLIDELNNIELLYGIHGNFIMKLFRREILDYFFNVCCYASSVDSRIVKYYANSATINVRVAPLSSGYSLDVHGVITVTHHLNKSTIYFKQQDGNVFCFEGKV